MLKVGSVTQGSKADPGDCWAVPCLTLLRSKSNSKLSISVFFQQLSTCWKLGTGLGRLAPRGHAHAQGKGGLNYVRTAVSDTGGYLYQGMWLVLDSHLEALCRALHAVLLLSEVQRNLCA
jgi:hypothetical protein